MATNKLELESLTIDEMLDLKDALEVKLTEIAKTEAALMTQRLERLKSYLPADKPTPAPPAKPDRSRSPSKAASKPAPNPPAKAKAKPKVTRKATKKTKVSAKYRDPDSGKTWSGRGMAPVWLRELEKSGRKREEFAV